MHLELHLDSGIENENLLDKVEELRGRILKYVTALIQTSGTCLFVFCFLRSNYLITFSFLKSSTYLRPYHPECARSCLKGQHSISTVFMSIIET